MTETQKLIQQKSIIINAMRELQTSYERDMEDHKRNLQSINNELYEIERDSQKELFD